MKLHKLVVLVSMALLGVQSANAATLFMPGNSGIPDQSNESSLDGGKNLCVPEVSSGVMRAAAFPIPYDQCFMSFPVNLPVGTTIDGVEIAYRSDAGGGIRSMTATLAANRLKPYMGPLPLGIAADSNVPTGQQVYKNMGLLNVPVISGDIYWVQISTRNVTEIDYVSVTYH
jgi:hypothetical protein